MILMFDTIIGLVKDPQFVIDSIDFALSFEYPSLDLAIEDLFWFNVDIIAEMSSA